MAWVSRRAARTDRIRAAALLWGGWVIVTGLVFSYMNGIIHPYYMVALAPGIGALVGIGAMTLCGGVWARRPRRPGQQGRPPEAAREKRHGVAARAVAAGTVLVTAVWSYVLLDRTPGWLPWLRWVVLLAGVLGAVTMLAGPWLASWRRLVLLPLGLAMVAGLAGPAAYALDTVSTAHTGAIPSAGPATGGFGGGGPGRFAGARPGGAPPGGTRLRGTRPGGTAGNGFPGGQAGQFGGPGGTGRTQAGTRNWPTGRNGWRRWHGWRSRREHAGQPRTIDAARAGRVVLQVGGRH